MVAGPGRLFRHRGVRGSDSESMIRHSASVILTTVRTLPGVQVPDVPMTAVAQCATVLVMDVPATAIPGIAGRQRDRGRFERQVAATAIHLRGLLATGTNVDADRVVRESDTVDLHRAAGQSDLGLNALAVQPG